MNQVKWHHPLTVGVSPRGVQEKQEQTTNTYGGALIGAGLGAAAAYGAVQSGVKGGPMSPADTKGIRGAAILGMLTGATLGSYRGNLKVLRQRANRQEPLFEADDYKSEPPIKFGLPFG